MLESVGCPFEAATVGEIISWQDNCYLKYEVDKSDVFKVQSCVKLDCVLAQNIFSIYFAVLMKFAFNDCDEVLVAHDERTLQKLFDRVGITHMWSLLDDKHQQDWGFGTGSSFRNIVLDTEELIPVNSYVT